MSAVRHGKMEKISIKTSQKFMKEVANKSLLSFMDALGVQS